MQINLPDSGGPDGKSPLKKAHEIPLSQKTIQTESDVTTESEEELVTLGEKIDVDFTGRIVVQHKNAKNLN